MTAAKAGAWGRRRSGFNTTHPAVSRTIEELDLEDAIGVRLLDRSRPRGRADPWSRAAPLTQRQFLMICVSGEEYRVSQRSDAQRDQDQRQMKPLSPGPPLASPPVPGHHHSCEIGKSAFDQCRHLRSHHRHQELRSSGCYIAVTTLIAALLQRFVSLRSGSMIPRSTIPKCGQRGK